MTVATRGQTVEPPDGENNIVPAQIVQDGGTEEEVANLAPTNSSSSNVAHSNSCTQTNCTCCQEPDFPHAKLASLDDKISSPRWVVPVLPDQELESLINASISLARSGEDVRSEACQRFYREGLTISFTKILTDEAVNSWKYNIHHCIHENCLRLVELCVIKLPYDYFPLLHLLSMVFNPHNRFHTVNCGRQSETVPPGSSIPEEDIFANSSDPRNPRGWLVDLINRFGSLGGFQALVERFQSGKNLTVPIIFCLLKPFGLCYEVLTVHTIVKYLMPIVERVPQLLDNLTDDELKKEAKNESKNDAISSIIKSAKCLVSRVSGQEETIKQLDIFRLKIILRLLQISSFNGKMNALNEVNKLIANVSYYPHRHSGIDSDGEWLTPERMAKWIKENGVLQIVLRDSLHQPQYVEKLEKILRFVIKEKCLSLEDLDSLWAAQQGKHEAIVKNVHDLLAKLAWDFSPEQLDHLFECFQSSWSNANRKQCEKLLELIRRLAEDDKDGVMAHKVLTLFWNLAHADDVVTEIMDQALNAHVKILDYSCAQERDAQKTEWLNKCVEELKTSDNWVLPALKQIKEIACLYEQPPNGNHRSHVYYRRDVISRLQTDHQLVVLVTNNLTNYMDKVRQIVKENPNLDPNEYCVDNRYNHIAQVQERLNFLRFLLKDGQLWLVADQAKQIWQCLAEGAVFTSDREACFKWFSKLMAQEDPDIDPAINKDFFQNNVLQLDPTLLTDSGMKCFDRFFKAVNLKEGKLKLKKRTVLMDDIDLIGLDYIWRVVTLGGDEMACKAIQVLKEVSTSLGPRLQAACVQFHQSFTSECMDRLRAHYDTVCVLQQQSDTPNPPGRLQLECIKMCRVLRVLQEYISEYDGEFEGERKHLPLYRACRGKQMSVVVRLSQPGRIMDDIEVQTHSNETLCNLRRFVLRRIRSSTNQNIKLDLFLNGEILDPLDDRRLLWDVSISDKMILSGKLSQANTNMGSSPDSSSDSSTSSPQHPFDTPGVKDENTLPGVILSEERKTAECLLAVCELGSKLNDTLLAQVSYNVLNLCCPDAYTLRTLKELFSDNDGCSNLSLLSGGAAPFDNDTTTTTTTTPSSLSSLPSLHQAHHPPTTLPSVQSLFFNLSSTHILYNLEVLYSLLMPALDPTSERSLEMQFNFLKSQHAPLILDILTKNNFMQNVDLPTKRFAYLTVLKISKLLLCVVDHIKCRSNQLKTEGSYNANTDHLCAISNPNIEPLLRNICSKLSQAYIDQMGVESKWSQWIPSDELIHNLMMLAWASACSDINLKSADVHKLHETVPKSIPSTPDILVCREALEVLTIALYLNPNALTNFRNWQMFIIDLMLVSSNRCIRIAAAEQFYLLATYNSQMSLFNSVPILFSHLHSTVMDYAKHSSEYFQVLCKLINFSYSYDYIMPEAEPLLNDEITWLKCTKDTVKETGKTGVHEAVLDGHLSLARELLNFMSGKKRAELGSDDRFNVNLVQELIEDFIFPASKLMLHLQKTGELIPEQAIPVCSSPPTLNSAFELLVGLSEGCVDNMRLVVNMLTDMFYSDDSEALQEWDYLPPIGPRPTSGFVGLKNAGATCYMNSVLQQLYMVPSIRQGLLAADGATPDTDDFCNDSESINSSCESEEKSSLEESRKEYNVGILKQVQAIFGHLAYSKLQYYVPKGLWRHFKLQGEPVNLREQQDAVEFFMSLVESIDDALKALGQEQIMSKILGGSYSDQKICKGCPHRYSKEEPFSVISVDIRNQSNLLDSLEQYVKGELLEGADAYHCDKCNKKVSTVKRLCVKKLPPILTIQLKRFEYDFERVCAIKFNDYFEFPRLLDMEPYTVSGLAKLEGEIDCDYSSSPKDVCTKYQLTGIIVHSGQASGGHYYSYVLHRSSETGCAKWYKFDDGEVTECKMEDDEEMKSQCFGGDYMGEVFDHMIKRMTYRRQKRWWNAYMLYYTRQDVEDNSLVKSFNLLSLKSKHGMIKMPVSIERSVRKQNISFMHTRSQFSAEYFQFMRRLATCNIPPSNRQHNADKQSGDGEELSLLSIQIVSRFLFHTGFHTKKCLRGMTTDWYDTMCYHLKSYASVRAWFAQNMLFKHPNRFCDYLLTCPSVEVRGTFMKIVVFLAHYSLHDGPFPPPPNPPAIFADPKATLSDHLLLCVLSMLQKEVADCGRHLVHYFALFHNYCTFGIQERAQLLKLNVAATFMLVALDDGPGPNIKYQYPEYTKLHCVVSQLIRCCDVSAKMQSSVPGQSPLPNPYGDPACPEYIMPIQPNVEEILFNRSSNYVKKVIEDCQMTEEGCKLLQYCSWENPHFSRIVLSELLWQIAYAYCNELKHHFDLLLGVITMEDSWISHRLHNALKGVAEERDGLFDTIQRSRTHYQKRAYQCIKCLVALFARCKTAYHLLQNNPDFRKKWSLAVDWLQDELDRRPYGLNPQYSWSPPTHSNDTPNGFVLERSNSARKTLEQAIELSPEEEPDEVEVCEESESGSQVATATTGGESTSGQQQQQLEQQQPCLSSNSSLSGGGGGGAPSLQQLTTGQTCPPPSSSSSASTSNRHQQQLGGGGGGAAYFKLRRGQEGSSGSGGSGSGGGGSKAEDNELLSTQYLTSSSPGQEETSSNGQNSNSTDWPMKKP